MKKIYIGCPVRRNDGLDENIITLARALQRTGCQAFAHPSVVELFRMNKNEKDKPPVYFDFKPEPFNDINRINEFDACIFDMGLDSSHDVGYQLAIAESRRMQTLLLCSHVLENASSRPFFLNRNGLTKRVYYGERTIPRIVGEFVKNLSNDRETIEDEMFLLTGLGKERK